MASITGDKALDKKFKSLATKGARRAAVAAIRKGMTIAAKGIRKLAPVGPTKNLKKSIGSRIKKTKKTGTVEAKAGVNVGKKTQKQLDKAAARSGKTAKTTKNAPHAHLVALGTKARKRKRLGGKFAYLNPASDQQLRTGTMPRNDFVKQGWAASQSEAAAAIKSELAKQIAKEAAKQ